MNLEAVTARVLGLERPGAEFSTMHFIDALDAGLPLAALDLVTHAVAPDDKGLIFRFVPRATLARRRKQQPSAKLSAEEGSKVARVARVWALAREVWGDDEATRSFLNRPHGLLDGQSPLAIVLKSEFGGPLVESILGRLRHGSAA